jgi:hypothetical protein
VATQENPHAGQGAVVLDIGEDIGALIVEMPAQMEDLEVEIIPTGTDERPTAAADHHGADHHSADHHSADHHSADHHSADHHSASHHGADDRDAGHVHDGSSHGHSHGPPGEHLHEHGAPPHVAVVARPAPDGSTIYSLVYGELQEGTYDLYVRPDGPVRLTASVTGGQVTELRWPDWPDAG